jgi:hypothetical protein
VDFCPIENFENDQSQIASMTGQFTPNPFQKHAVCCKFVFYFDDVNIICETSTKTEKSNPAPCTQAKLGTTVDQGHPFEILDMFCFFYKVYKVSLLERKIHPLLGNRTQHLWGSSRLC